MKTLVNGEVTDFIPVSDRGLQYGDGVWETLYIVSGKPILLDAHLHRLQLACKALQISGLDNDLLRTEVDQLAAKQHEKIIKIIVTRGSGGRGYSPEGLHKPSRILSLHDKPASVEKHRHAGIAITTCKTPFVTNLQLSGFKHLNCLQQVLARSELNEDYQEGIVCDQDGLVIEGTMSNIFLIQGDKVVTPNLNTGGIRGIMRNYLLKKLRDNNTPVREKQIQLSEVKSADAIFFTNSVIGLWPVNHFAGKAYQYENSSFAASIIQYLQQQIEILETPSGLTN